MAYGYDPFEGIVLPALRRPSAQTYTFAPTTPYNNGGKPQVDRGDAPWRNPPAATPYNNGGKPQVDRGDAPWRQPVSTTPYNNGGKPQVDRGDRPAYSRPARPVVDRFTPSPRY